MGAHRGARPFCSRRPAIAQGRQVAHLGPSKGCARQHVVELHPAGIYVDVIAPGLWQREGNVDLQLAAPTRAHIERWELFEAQQRKGPCAATVGKQRPSERGRFLQRSRNDERHGGALRIPRRLSQPNRAACLLEPGGCENTSTFLRRLEGTSPSAHRGSCGIIAGRRGRRAARREQAGGGKEKESTVAHFRRVEDNVKCPRD
jgi:hypothetical protein